MKIRCLDDSQTGLLKNLKVINIFKYKHDLVSKEFSKHKNLTHFCNKTLKSRLQQPCFRTGRKNYSANQIGRPTWPSRGRLGHLAPQQCVGDSAARTPLHPG